MAHFLVIESFIGGNAVLLPKKMVDLGHTYTFMTRSTDIYKNAYQKEDHEVIRYAKEILIVDTNDDRAILERLENQTYDGVLTTCDYYIDQVVMVSKARSIPCPFPEKVDTFRYKHKMRLALDLAKLANAKFALAETWEGVLASANLMGYPLVLKPVDLSSSAFVRLISNDDDLKMAFYALEGFPLNWRKQKRDMTFLLEEYMTGEEFSVEAISNKGQTQIIGITKKSIMGKPYFIEDGHMFPAGLSEDMALEISNYVIRVLESTGFDHGVSHTEVKWAHEGPKIVEINPRPAGGRIVELIKMTKGVDLLHVFIDLALWKSPKINQTFSGIQSACIRYITAPEAGVIKGISGEEALRSYAHVHAYEIEACSGKNMGALIDNASRVGWIITKDLEGYEAMRYGDEALAKIEIHYA